MTAVAKKVVAPEAPASPESPAVAPESPAVAPESPAVPSMQDSLPTGSTIDVGGAEVRKDSIYLEALPSTTEGVKTDAALLVARLVTVGHETKTLEASKRLAGLQMLTIRRRFVRTIVVNKVELTIPDLIGESGAYKTEEAKVNGDAINALRKRWEAEGMSPDVAEKEAKSRINTAMGTARAQVRRILDDELTVAQLKLHGFKWSSALGKGQKLAKPANVQTVDRITSQVKAMETSAAEAVGHVALAMSSPDPTAIVLALLPILKSQMGVTLPAEVKENAQAVKAVFGDLVATVNAIGITWGLVQAPKP